MDEDSSGPHCSYSTGMDDSRLLVCVAGSLFRRRPASCSAAISYALVVLGYGYATHLLGGPEDPRFPQAACPAGSGAFSSEPAGDGWVRLSVGRRSRSVR